MRLSLLIAGLVLFAVTALIVASLGQGQTLAVDLSVLRSGDQPATLHVSAMSLSLSLCGLTAAATVVIVAGIVRIASPPGASRPGGPLGRFRPDGDLRFLFDSPLRELLMFGTLLALGLIASVAGHLSVPRAILLAAFGTAAIGIAIRAIVALDNDPLELRSSWGGLGGGMGGWSLSRTTVLFLLALTFAGATIVAAIEPPPDRTPPSNQPGPAASPGARPTQAKPPDPKPANAGAEVPGTSSPPAAPPHG